MILVIIITELLIVMRFDFHVITIPLPRSVALSWLLFISCLIVWTIWQFFYRGKMRVGFGTMEDSGVGLAEFAEQHQVHPVESPCEEGSTMSFRMDDLAKDKNV